MKDARRTEEATMIRPAMALVLVFAIPACENHSECLMPPCPLHVAVRVDISSATTGSAIHSASVAVSGPTVSTVPCDSSCAIFGNDGKYTLNVTAPGYQGMERSVVVPGSAPACGCASVQTQQVTFALTPS